jgi:transcriptional regulator with XRE-family HTH domain
MSEQMFDFKILRELRKRAGLNIADVSERSGVSAAVISKLERNQCLAGLDTIYKLSRVFECSPADLVALAEQRTANRASSKPHESDGFMFDEVVYGNIRCLHGKAPAGAKVSRPHLHRDDYELCWVLNGRLMFFLPNEKHELTPGDSIQFDALLEHTYEALEDTEMLILHIRKEKRF